MPLSPGTRLGHYEITANIGAGGMGEVYKARDTQLNRDVAIKILPQSLANDADYITRFQREAQSLAALHHPNIASIFGLEQNAIVMELVDGKPLQGPLPLTELLPIAKQIAEALEAAHDKGIIHRDLKPANILLTANGTVKVLDFGLAKAVEKPTENSPNSPTLTLRATEAGLILGTAAYMAPEQAAGKPVDRRADIWSFGVVLHELITGKQLFQGETVSHTLAEVLKTEIDFAPIPAGSLRDLLKRCLDRNLKSRLQHIGEARIAIDNYNDAPPPVQPQFKRWHWALVATAALSTVLAAWALLRPQPQTPQSTIRVSTPVLTTETVDGIGVAISRDGEYLAYCQPQGENKASIIMLRQTDQFVAKPLAGTEGAARLHFSPDGKWILFSTGTTTRKISILGGQSVPVNDTYGGLGRTWDGDDALILGGAPLVRVREDGAKPEEITKLENGEASHRWPFFLPAGGALLFNPLGGYHSLGAPIDLLELKPGTRRRLSVKGSSPRYVPTGHLVYARNSTLFAIPFDPKRFTVNGPEVPVVQDLFHNPSGDYADYSFSSTGHLVYHSRDRSAPRELVWANLTGTSQPLPGGAKPQYDSRLSPRGDRLATVMSNIRISGDIWIRDWERGIDTRLTSDATNYAPVWTPDGRNLVFARQGEIVTAAIDGSEKPTVLIPLPPGRVLQTPHAMSPDGRTLFFSRRQSREITLWTRTASDSNGQPALKQVGTTQGNNPIFCLAPDGNSFAFNSTESGASELYLQTYPAPGTRVQISANGATQCLWSPDGKRLYFKASVGNSPLMASAIQITGSQIRAGRPEPLFNFDGELSGISPDGKRFLFLRSATAEDTSPKLNLVLNWFDELRRLSPVTGAPPPPKPN